MNAACVTRPQQKSRYERKHRDELTARRTLFRGDAR